MFKLLFTKKYFFKVNHFRLKLLHGTSFFTLFNLFSIDFDLLYGVSNIDLHLQSIIICLFFKFIGIISSYLLVLLQLKLQETEITVMAPSNEQNSMFE